MRHFTALLLICLCTARSASADVARQSLDELRAAAEQFVRAQVGEPGPPVQVQIGALDERLRLAPCSGVPQGVLPVGTRIAARMTIGLRCVEPLWTVYVPVAVQSEVDVLVTRVALARNVTPRLVDVERQRRWVPGFAHLYVTDPAVLAGRHLRHAVSPGTALTVEQLAADVLMKRGQRVTLVASSGGFEVRAQGEALADSGAGGRVRVQNLTSRQVVEGIAESATLVRVN